MYNQDQLQELQEIIDQLAQAPTVAPARNVLWQTHQHLFYNTKRTPDNPAYLVYSANPWGDGGRIHKVMQVIKDFPSNAAAERAFERIQSHGVTNEQGNYCRVKFASFSLNDWHILASSSYYSEETLRDAIDNPEIL